MDKPIKIKIIDIEQYLLSGNYKYSHQNIKIPVNIGHIIYSLNPSYLKLFLYLLSRTVCSPGFTASISVVTVSHAVGLRRNTVIRGLLVLKEKQMVSLYDLMDLMDLIDMKDLKTVQTKKSVDDTQGDEMTDSAKDEKKKEEGQLKFPQKESGNFYPTRKSRSIEEQLAEAEKLGLSREELEMLKIAIQKSALKKA